MKNKSIWIKAILVMLILCGILVLSACGSAEEEEETDTTDKEKECEHVVEQWFVVKEATCVDGSEEGECVLCKEKLTKTVKAIFEHEYGEWEIVTPGSCKALEKKTKKCKTCPDSITEEAKEYSYHTYGDDFKCTACGIQATPELEYTLSADEKFYILSGIDFIADPENPDKTIEILAMDTVKGVPVTTVADDAFLGCEMITKVTLPETITEIGAGAFKNCKKLTAIDIPADVTVIGKGALEGCVALEGITLPFVGAEKDGDVNTHFGYIFGAASEAENRTFVPKSLKNVAINGKVAIADFAFSGCDMLTAVELADGIKAIGSNAFAGCDALTAVVIPGSVEKIGTMAFYGCDLLANVKLSENIKIIGSYAFSDCVALTSVTFPKTITQICDGAFKGCVKLEGASLRNVESLNSIGESAFEGCVALKAITLGDNVETIADRAFAGCIEVEALTLSNALKSIGDFAFEGCDKVKEVVITKNVTIIGESAFASCDLLTKVSFDRDTKIAVIEDGVFADCVKLQTIVFAGDQEDWDAVEKGTDWNKNVGSALDKEKDEKFEIVFE